MKVLWTKNAIEHLAGIYDYIALNSPTYAKRMADKITRRSLQIAGMPYSGRQVPEYEADEVRELVEFPYRIKIGQIDVLAVIHGARQLPGDI